MQKTLKYTFKKVFFLVSEAIRGAVRKGLPHGEEGRLEARVRHGGQRAAGRAHNHGRSGGVDHQAGQREALALRGARAADPRDRGAHARGGAGAPQVRLFVRYKVDAIERQYLTAKQWLLETGMHDAFMRGKATPEVRAHVEHLCPLFRRLDPAFRGVPFSQKNAETIELDTDSAEDGEESRQEIKVPDSDEEEEVDDEEEEESSSSSGNESEEVYDGEEEDEEDEGQESSKDKKKKSQAAKAASQKASTPPKRSLFRDRMLARAAEVEEPLETQKKAPTFRERMVAAEEEKTSTPVEKPKKTSSASGKRVLLKVTERKKKTLTKTEKKAGAVEERVSATTANVVEKEKPSKAVDAEKETPSKPAEPQTEELPKPTETESDLAPVKKRRGRPPKSATAAPPTANGVQETAPKSSGKKAQKSISTKRKTSEEAASTGKRSRSQQQDEENAVKRPRTQKQDEETAVKCMPAQKKQNGESATTHAPTQEQGQAERKAIMEIEREALLKRVDDEQKQRHDVYGLERAKLKCELEAKQVQLLFEKATARKKLDQLGVPQEEIDRLLPL
ncbi:hypothetical protein ON010_g1165 [Phytophthora cinnamomi]|nr:hypothetical protein ON010_g1165 [Phytophthora cinnamomi]